MSDADDVTADDRDEEVEREPSEHDGVFHTGETVAVDPVEPGSPTLENAAFVLLGVASMIALILHFLSMVG